MTCDAINHRRNKNSVRPRNIIEISEVERLICVMLREVRGKTPIIGADSYVADNASVIGDVQIGTECTILFSSVVRGDVMPIRIGNQCNIQDLVMIHGTYQKVGTTLGDRVSVGHGAILHGATVDSGSLIGMGVILMDGCHIGENCLVAAGSLVTENSSFPPGQLIVGRPASVKRALTSKEIESLGKSADNYLLYKKWYQETCE